MKHTKPWIILSAAIASSFLLTSCGPSTDEVAAMSTPEQGTVATETTAPSDPMESSSDTPETSKTPQSRFVNTEKDGVTYTNGIPLKGVSKNAKGSYAQTTVDDDADYMKYNPNIVSKSTSKAVKSKKLSQKEVLEAQHALMTFVAEEALDSPLNGGNNVDAWLKKHADIIHPEFKTEIEKDLKSSDAGTFLVRGTDDGYSHYYNKDHGRLTSRDLSLSKVEFLETEGYDALVFNVNFSMTAPLKNDKDVMLTELTSGDLTYSLIKHEGKWKLAAWQNGYQTKELKTP